MTVSRNALCTDWSPNLCWQVCLGQIGEPVARGSEGTICGHREESSA